MDLGFSRDLKSYLAKKDLLVKDMRGKLCNKAWIGEFRFSSNLKYQMAIISKQNANKHFDEYLEFAKELDTVEVYVLTNGAHPNAKQGRESVENNLIEFKRLEKDIRKSFI